jgi:hypothetical protein
MMVVVVVEALWLLLLWPSWMEDRLDVCGV